MSVLAAGAAAVVIVALATGPAPSARATAALGTPPAPRLTAWCNRHLRRADLNRVVASPVPSWFSVVGLAALGGGAIGGGVRAAAVAAGLGAVAPIAVVGLRGDRHRTQLRAELPAVIDLVAREIRLGSSQRAAIEAVVGSPALRHAAAELGVVLDHADRGQPVGIALAAWAERSGLREAQLLVAAMTLANRVGGDDATALEQIAGAVRMAHGAEKEAMALAAQGRLSAQIIAIAPIVVGGGIIASDRSVLAVLSAPTGLAVLAVGLSLNVGGFLWMRRIVAYR